MPEKDSYQPKQGKPSLSPPSRPPPPPPPQKGKKDDPRPGPGWPPPFSPRPTDPFSPLFAFVSISPVVVVRDHSALAPPSLSLPPSATPLPPYTGALDPQKQYQDHLRSPPPSAFPHSLSSSPPGAPPHARPQNPPPPPPPSSSSFLSLIYPTSAAPRRPGRPGPFTPLPPSLSPPPPLSALFPLYIATHPPAPRNKQRAHAEKTRIAARATGREWRGEREHARAGSGIGPGRRDAKARKPWATHGRGRA